MNIFTPLYISDVCTNQCRYCGFNAKNKQPRRHLSIDEAAAEADVIADKGFQHILLLTGDARHLSSPQYIADAARRIKPRFASVGVEVYSLTTEEYELLVNAGVDSMTMFQETYNPELYAWLHPVGPKHDYGFRLNAAAARGRGRHPLHRRGAPCWGWNLLSRMPLPQACTHGGCKGAIPAWM